MSTGTEIIKQALRQIGAHSSAAPADPESILIGMDALNSMVQKWESKGIKLGCVPLSAPGDDLSEPLDAKNAIIDNLSLQLAPNFNSVRNSVSNQLRINASDGYAEVKAAYRTTTIPNKVASSTLPKGQGNIGRNNRFNYPNYFEEDEKLDA